MSIIDIVRDSTPEGTLINATVLLIMIIVAVKLFKEFYDRGEFTKIKNEMVSAYKFVVKKIKEKIGIGD